MLRSAYIPFVSVWWVLYIRIYKFIYIYRVFINRYKKVKKKKIENRTFCIILCIVPNIICTVSPSYARERVLRTRLRRAREGRKKIWRRGRTTVADEPCGIRYAVAAEKRWRRRGAWCVRPCRGNRCARARWRRRRQNGDPLKNILMKLLLNQ